MQLDQADYIAADRHFAYLPVSSSFIFSMFELTTLHISSYVLYAVKLPHYMFAMIYVSIFAS